MNHLQTLVQRELAGKKEERALDLSERSRVRALKMFNELIAAGAQKPEIIVNQMPQNKKEYQEHSADGSQPFCSEPNRTSSAAGSHR